MDFEIDKFSQCFKFNNMQMRETKTHKKKTTKQIISQEAWHETNSWFTHDKWDGKPTGVCKWNAVTRERKRNKLSVRRLHFFHSKMIV